jgi:hypothetical protein
VSRCHAGSILANRTVVIVLRVALVGFAASVLCLAGTSNPLQAPLGRAFPSADAAAQGLVSAAMAGDAAGLLEILGPGGEAFVSIQPGADKRIQRDFAAQASLRMRLVIHPARPNEVVVLTGHHDSPLPISIVEINGKWYFDTNHITRRKLKASK